MCPESLCATSARGDQYDSFSYRTAKEVNASRKCKTASEQSAKTECSYSFAGIRLRLVLDPRDPQSNVFLVESGPAGKDTFLKFGGVHTCAIISHYGRAGEMAHVFISPRSGDVYMSWDVPACAK